jgi:hypothetical protein
VLFCSNSKVNKLVLLRRELYPMLSRLFQTVLMNLAKHSTVLLCALAVSKKVKIIDKPYSILLGLADWLYKGASRYRVRRESGIKGSPKAALP